MVLTILTEIPNLCSYAWNHEIMMQLVLIKSTNAHEMMAFLSNFVDLSGVQILIRSLVLVAN